MPPSRLRVGAWPWHTSLSSPHTCVCKGASIIHLGTVIPPGKMCHDAPHDVRPCLLLKAQVSRRLLGLGRKPIHSHTLTADHFCFLHSIPHCLDDITQASPTSYHFNSARRPNSTVILQPKRSSTILSLSIYESLTFIRNYFKNRQNAVHHSRCRRSCEPRFR